MKKIIVLILLVMLHFTVKSQTIKLECTNAKSMSNSGMKIIKNPLKKNSYLKGLSNRSWIKFDDIDFANKRFNAVKYKASASKVNKFDTLEIREGGIGGELISSCIMPFTNSDEDFNVVESKIIKFPKGVNDIFLVVKSKAGASFNLDYVEFCNDSKKSSLKDFFMPMKPVRPLVKKDIWGNDFVLPRDTANGLEDTHLRNYCYWDGQIVKDDKGKYHMYASRWSQTYPHTVAWKEASKGAHAVSDNLMGPYIDKGLVYPNWNGGKGHNVVGLRMADGRYAVVASEIVKGDIFVSDNPDGPFNYLGEIKVDANGHSMGLAAYRGGTGNMANVQILLRPDGRYMLVARSTAIMISDNGILGPYKIMTDRLFENYPELPHGFNEDPTLWYSGGMYHVVYNNWPSQTLYHFASKDGIKDWKYCGVFLHKDTENVFKYTDGTENKWPIVERPTAVVEEGHLKAFMFSVLDTTTKWGDQPNDNHGSKIVIVPFNGDAFDKYMKKLMK